MTRTKFLATLILVGLVAACGHRPPPQIAADFESRRPLIVAVMPAVYLPHDPKTAPPDVKSSFYYKCMMASLDLDNKVLKEMERAVAKTLGTRGIQVIDPARVEEVLKNARINPPLYWQEIQRELAVDSLVFTNLDAWGHGPGSTSVGTMLSKQEIEQGDKENVKVYDWSESGDKPATQAEAQEDAQVQQAVSRMRQFARSARQSVASSLNYSNPHLQHISVHIETEFALYNASQGDVLWRDKNYPTVISVQRVRRNANQYVADRAVALAFKSFPMK